MIGRLEGRILEKGERRVLLDVVGIGYEIEVPDRAMEELADQGESQVLHTHFLVREDSQRLFGFTRVPDRDIFRLLLRTDGVGPALALALLSTFTPVQLAEYAHTDNTKALSQVSGVGKRTAERLCVNLKHKLAYDESQVSDRGPAQPGAGTMFDAVEKTLVQQLGFKSQEAKSLVRGVVHPDMEFEEALQAALRASMGNRA